MMSKGKGKKIAKRISKILGKKGTRKRGKRLARKVIRIVRGQGGETLCHK